ncbi:MAG: DUF6527 family protein [Actinomycetota bacterium]|nr:DUF6527 family protein [Actinomycetota bacterium]
MKQRVIAHEFVELVPEELEEGKLYISIPYETAVHLCACGCGIKVVTPISPPEWLLIWDGDTVSLTPSIGNWQFPCRSHYWITRSRVVWAGALSDARIAEGRRREAVQRDAYHAERQLQERADPHTPHPRAHTSAWQRLRRALRRH